MSDVTDKRLIDNPSSKGSSTERQKSREEIVSANFATWVAQIKESLEPKKMQSKTDKDLLQRLNDTMFQERLRVRLLGGLKLGDEARFELVSVECTEWVARLRAFLETKKSEKDKDLLRRLDNPAFQEAVKNYMRDACDPLLQKLEDAKAKEEAGQIIVTGTQDRVSGLVRRRSELPEDGLLRAGLIIVRLLDQEKKDIDRAEKILNYILGQEIKRATKTIKRTDTLLRSWGLK